MESKKELHNSQVEVNLSRPIKVIHFSDGIEEIMEENQVTELDSAPKDNEVVDPKTLSWGPWFTYQTWKSGSKVLGALDYAGETLANFFGITTPKYIIEIEEYERMQMEKKKIDEESAGWVPKSVDIPLVLNEPIKTDKEENV
ncbi:protein FAM177A1-like [Danaus plexippus]|nr:protein FAM177A1-like [Danaus plexippus]